MHACPECDGLGWKIEQVPVPTTICCGNILPHGECCGNGVAGQEWEQEQVRCHACAETGYIPRLVYL